MSNKTTRKHNGREQGKHNGSWCDWAGNEIGDEGARALGDALKTNTTLTELHLNSEQQNHKERNEREQGKHNGSW